MLYTLKGKVQKLLHGWSKEDCYNINEWFIKTLIPMLEYYRNYMSYPAVKVVSKEEWNFILDKMIYHLNMMNIDNILKEKNINNPTAADFELAYSVKKRNTKEFFELFEKYFF